MSSSIDSSGRASTHTQPGRLIALCGIDGTGKSSQERLLVDWLAERRIPTCTTAQPTSFYRDTPAIRKLWQGGEDELGLLGQALLSAADRQRHLRMIVRPALERGELVLCNRYVYSFFAYFEAQGLSPDYLRVLAIDVELPHLTVLLDAPAADCAARVAARDNLSTVLAPEHIDFMERVRQHFLGLADETFLIVDARDSAQAIHAQIVQRVGSFLSQTRI